MLFSSSHIKFGALLLLLLNSIRSEKSSSAMGSGNGLAGLLRGGRYPPREPDDVDGSDNKSSLASDDPTVMLVLSEAADDDDNCDDEEEEEEDDDDEGDVEFWPRKDKDGGGDETEIPESGELLVDVSPVLVELEALVTESEGELLFSAFLIRVLKLGVIMFLMRFSGGCHNTTSMLGLVNFFNNDAGSCDSPGIICFTSSAMIRHAGPLALDFQGRGIPSSPKPSSGSSSSIMSMSLAQPFLPSR